MNVLVFDFKIGVEMETETLPESLGTTAHLSPLLRKANRLGLDEIGLRRLAIQRGRDYYDSGKSFSSLKISEKQFSNVELAITLLNPALKCDPQTLRLGAAMLSALGNDPEEVA